MSRLIELAKRESAKSNMLLRLGCVIRDHTGRKYTGHNTCYNPGMCGISTHAEMDALQKCLKRYRMLSLVRLFLNAPHLQRKAPQILSTYSRLSRSKEWWVQGTSFRANCSAGQQCGWIAVIKAMHWLCQGLSGMWTSKDQIHDHTCWRWWVNCGLHWWFNM